MKITVNTFGSRGDVQPYIALALGLRQAGHAVRIVTHQIFQLTFSELILFHTVGFSRAWLLQSTMVGPGPLRPQCVQACRVS